MADLDGTLAVSKPPIIFSPRFFRLVWLIVKARFRSEPIERPPDEPDRHLDVGLRKTDRWL